MKTSIATLIIGISTLTLSGCFATSASSEESTPELRSEFTASGNYEKELTDTEIKTDLNALSTDLDINSLNISGLQNNISGLNIGETSDDESNADIDGMRLARTTSANNCIDLGNMDKEKTEGVKGSGQYSYEKVFMSGPSQICEGDRNLSFQIHMNIEEEEGKDISEMHMSGKYELNMNEAAKSVIMNADFSGYGTIIDENSTVNLSFLMNMNIARIGKAMTTSMNMKTIVHLMDDKYRCTIGISFSNDLLSKNTTGPTVTETNTCELTHNGQIVGSLKLEGDEVGVYDVDGNKITQ
jgi:hypothetical protein